MAGGIAFVLPVVRQQREGQKPLNRKSEISDTFGSDAATVFEPFLRALIPKLYL